MKMSVVDIIEKSSDCPFILTYQGGNQLATKKGVKRSLEISTDEKTQKRRLQVTLDEHTYEGDEQPAGPTRKFIVVRKASTGEVFLVESAELDLVHSSLMTKKEAVAADDKDYMTKVSALQKTFGGKRGQRRMEKSEKYRMNNSINEESLLAAVNASFDTSILNSSKKQKD